MKRSLAAFILFYLLCQPALLNSQDLEINRGLKRIDIPFEYVNGFILVRLTFNGVFPLRFIFDTGAEHTILSKREITDMLNVDYQRRFTIIGADMSTELYAYLAQGIQLQVGSITAKNRSILVLEEDYFRFEEYAGINVQGILGSDFFRRFIVKINYSRNTISLYDPQHFNPPGRKYTAIPVDISRNKPYLSADVFFQKDTSLQLRLLIDSGASLALLLHTDTHPSLEVPERVIPTNLGMGLGGYIKGYLGRVQRLKAGPFDFTGVITQFQEISMEVDTSFSRRRNGIIGNDILRRFTVIIDYIHERIYLEPNRDYDEQFKYDRSGLLLAAAGVNLNEFLIYGVVPGSPADEAGLKPGDELVNINFMPAGLLSLENINRRLKKREGKKIRLKIKRGEEKLVKRFRLRKLI